MSLGNQEQGEFRVRVEVGEHGMSVEWGWQSLPYFCWPGPASEAT